MTDWLAAGSGHKDSGLIGVDALWQPESREAARGRIQIENSFFMCHLQKGKVVVKSEYDLSTMKSRKNPYAAKLKKSVTMRLSEDVIDYFKKMSEETGVPYQSLINLYLKDCVAQHRKIDISWQTHR